MTKPRSQAVPRPGQGRDSRDDAFDTVKEPLSGSKKVKNHNHSRQNHGEGS
ncbi:Small acid-soluble spore protein P family [Thermobacillus composti KWC4]|uniref:Small acid-soluble spore protein P family n=1 Tax=Thermobacillus composti (strain DSM 18247 / JCM 13945 / KWC4) TaxID=717605 RepID=L0EK78_THECK|nr:small acid-soluble spore protein P [Thermobacillus composti]AGA59670.1 Small acid-soluble spore protein P family [Thermobacillus composti KWC4]